MGQREAARDSPQSTEAESQSVPHSAFNFEVASRTNVAVNLCMEMDSLPHHVALLLLPPLLVAGNPRRWKFACIKI